MLLIKKIALKAIKPFIFMFYSISRPYDSFSGGEWGMGVRGGEGGFATIPGKY